MKLIHNLAQDEYQDVFNECRYQIAKRSYKNLGSFANTVMEPKAVELFSEFSGINAVDFFAYPEIQDMMQICKSFILDLVSTSKTVSDYDAFATSGSSEAIILSLFFLKHAWLSNAPKDSKPSLVVCENCHVAWQKAATLLQVELVVVALKSDSLIFDGDNLESVVNENTIGVVCTLGITRSLYFDDVQSINSKLKSIHREKGLFIPIHVDAASGGFVAPFQYPKLKWDFRLEHVSMINVSSHKYGMVYPGLAWLCFKRELQISALAHENTYLGNKMHRFQLQFSHSAGPLVAQYYFIEKYKFSGYKDIMTTLFQRCHDLKKSLLAMSGVHIVTPGRQPSLPGIILRLDRPDITMDELSQRLSSEGWHLPTFDLVVDGEIVRVGRIILRYGMHPDLLEAFFLDLCAVLP